jgi:hypothetical protein
MKTFGLVYQEQELGIVQKDSHLVKQMKPLPSGQGEALLS